MSGSHLASGPRASRFDRTPREWLPFGKQIADIANVWADREDIVAFVGAGAVQDEAGNQLSLACFRPDTAEMELAPNLAFGEGVNPRWLPDFNERSTHFAYPEVAGAVLHEAMHAKHTRFDLKEVGEAVEDDNRLGDLIMWFEEIRIENRGIEMYPRNRSFLRAMSMKFIVEDLAKSPEKFQAGGMQSVSFFMILVEGRVDGGVLDYSDAELVRNFTQKLFGPALCEKLQSIWLRALGHRRDSDFEPLKALAEEWLKTLEDAGHETKPEKMSDEQKKALGEALKKLAEAMEEQAEETADDAADEAAGQEVAESREEQLGKAREAGAEAKEAKDTAKEVFGRSTGPSDCRTTDSTLQEKRDPTGAERSAAIKISKALEKAKYRDRVVVKRRTELPPGRLNGRAGMQRDVQLARGQKVTAEPWTHKHRFHTEDPELKIGMMVDISGSMSSAMEPMAVSAWLMSEAARRVQGKIASVYYGNGVFPVLKPGQHLDKVHVYSAPDGTERFDQAFKALDGALGLLSSSGARLLVIASDMCYTAGERTATKTWIKRCNQAGVGVLCLPFTHGGGYVESVTKGLQVEILRSMDPVAVASEIGQSAVKVLERAGNRVM